MKPAWRGVVLDGEVWAWPMILWSHNEAFAVFNALQDYTCRWRQWEPGGKIDFDLGASAEDIAKVEEWLRRQEADPQPKLGGPPLCHD